MDIMVDQFGRLAVTNLYKTEHGQLTCREDHQCVVLRLIHRAGDDVDRALANSGSSPNVHLITDRKSLFPLITCQDGGRQSAKEDTSPVRCDAGRSIPSA